MSPADRIATLFDTFAPADVARLGDYYANDARFIDPFNDVRGLAAIQHVYSDMFERLQEPRLRVTRRFESPGECMLLWDFRFRLGSGPVELPGASHLQLAADGRIALHRDYWDAAGGLYEKIPGLGMAMRWLRRRASAA